MIKKRFTSNEGRVSILPEFDNITKGMSSGVGDLNQSVDYLKLAYLIPVVREKDWPGIYIEPKKHLNINVDPGTVIYCSNEQFYRGIPKKNPTSAFPKSTSLKIVILNRVNRIPWSDEKKIEIILKSGKRNINFDENVKHFNKESIDYSRKINKETQSNDKVIKQKHIESSLKFIEMKISLNKIQFTGIKNKEDMKDAADLLFIKMREIQNNLDNIDINVIKIVKKLLNNEIELESVKDTKAVMFLFNYKKLIGKTRLKELLSLLKKNRNLYEPLPNSFIDSKDNFVINSKVSQSVSTTIDMGNYGQSTALFYYNVKNTISNFNLFKFCKILEKNSDFFCYLDTSFDVKAIITVPEDLKYHFVWLRKTLIEEDLEPSCIDYEENEWREKDCSSKNEESKVKKFCSTLTVSCDGLVMHRSPTTEIAKKLYEKLRTILKEEQNLL